MKAPAQRAPAARAPASKPAAPRAPARPAIVTSREIAVKLVAKLDESMGELQALLAEETRLVKAGKLRAAGELSLGKEEKATLYTRLMLAARDEIEALKTFAPGETNALIKRHEAFRADVQVNLAVLNTAKDIAEDIMRTVASEVGKTTHSGIYGRPNPSARSAPVDTSARGIAINMNI